MSQAWIRSPATVLNLLGRLMSKCRSGESQLMKTATDTTSTSGLVRFSTIVTQIRKEPPLTTTSSSYLIPVRHRYFDPDRVVYRRWGRVDKMSWRGPLPRLPLSDKLQRLPGPVFAPKNNWSQKKALFGQNDYIDILGSPDIHPVRIAYGVPYWLRGFAGNEYQMLLRKRTFFGPRITASNPMEHGRLKKRIRHLFKTLNRKRKSRFNPNK